MSLKVRMLTLAAPLLASACANPDSVLFVTNTSLGIQVESKPPSASIAYDRTEGFSGPRYQNGGLPPVVASLATNGSVLDPQIRQVYATGAAAVKAVSGANAPDGPTALTGDRKLAFFGTATTIGLKAGFSPDGSPDSFVLGYKRKEVSFIPLGSTQVNGVATDVYPSVLGSIDTTGSALSLQGTSLTTLSFFATGEAAEVLAATNGSVRSTFHGIAEDALTAALSETQRKAVVAKGMEYGATQDAQLGKIMAYVAPGGTVDPKKLGDLIDRTNTKAGRTVAPEDLKGLNADQLRARLNSDLYVVGQLYAAMSANPSGT